MGIGWIHVYMTTPPTMTGDIGKWWDLELHCEGPGDAIFDLYDSSGYVLIDTITVHQIPEPMTISLFGLGAVLLGRRKNAGL
jgi:hypothetical protein